MRNSVFYLLAFSVFFAVSCNTSYKVGQVEYSSYPIQKQNNNDQSLNLLIKPYGDSVSKLMNVVIGNNETKLERDPQFNTLGYFMTDAYLEMAKQKVDPEVDLAFMNTGGVRLPDLPAGPIIQGKIFELMPFDNLMVILKMKGNMLQQYLDTLAATDGIIESGMTLKIVNSTAQKVIINGKTLDPNADYSIVHSDYAAINSGLLKNIKRTTNGYLLRDALLDYVKFFERQGKKVIVSNTDRISYVN